jgi:hypothetical protein
MKLPLLRPTDCAAADGPTISRVPGCIGDDTNECVVCGQAVVDDMTEHHFFGFACSCPYGPSEKEEP